jgi:Ca-activated chloride channel family protein
MVVRDWFATRRIRHGATAGVVALATGGLFLLRASAAPGAHPAPQGPAPSPPTPVLVSPLPGPVGPTGAVGPTEVSFSGPHVAGTFAVSDARVLAGRDQPFYADITLRAESRPEAHAPLALVVVLDTSGSMEGEKLREAKDAVKGLVRDMNDDDEIAFVHYSDTAEVVQPLTAVREVRGRLPARIDALRADGGTAIPLGLAAGMRALDGETGNRVRRIVLVSDGLDSSRPRSESLARKSAEEGITVSSMGIGLDFDESYMGALARSGHGNFGFVNDGPTLTAFLQRELVQTATTTAEGTIVHMHLPDGLRFVKATGADAELHGSDVDLRVGALFANEAKRVLVQMASDLGAGRTADFRSSVTWQTVAGARAEASVPELDIVGTADADEVAHGRNETVLARATSVEASERELEAAQAYAGGDTGRAQDLIQSNMMALRHAAAAAPAAVARALVAQSASYDQTRREFGRVAPSSAGGRGAAKAAAANNMANADRSAF